MDLFPDLATLSQAVKSCARCVRLQAHCQEVAREKRRAYESETYWGKPVAGFGDPLARLVVVGLAPGAHGANRTGRVFTGDRSGEWLFRALHKRGFASQARSESLRDGLRLQDCYVTCAVRCAPPGNKPSPEETRACAPFLQGEIALLPRARVFMALGGFALKALWPWVAEPGLRRPPFKHGASADLGGGKSLLMSYHPSQQNTFTGRLTEPMLDSVLDEAELRIAHH